MVWYVVLGVVLLVLILSLLLVKCFRGFVQGYERLYQYLVERGVSKVEVVLPVWCEYGRVRLYDREGRFLEELVVKKEDWWYCILICKRLEREGFEVVVKRF
jgi:hypothetical protein